MKRLKTAKKPILKQKATTSGYGKLDKTRSADAHGFAWETTHTFSESAAQPR